MHIGNHEEGFEKEAALRMIHSRVSEIQTALYMWRKFIEVAELIHPELCEGTFERRPCRRKLRYIGYDYDSSLEQARMQNIEKCHEHFIRGEIYYSVDFNGSTYSIEGWTENNNGSVIGFVYFEWLLD